MATLEEDKELSPEQIDALLERAERRLKEVQQLVSTASNSKFPNLPKLQHDNISTSYIRAEHGVVHTEPRSAVSGTQRKLFEQPRKFVDPVIVKQQRKQKAETLPEWFNLPKTDLTPELKRDLQLLNMRSVLDPKRMYKNQGKLKIPEYSQVGTLIEGPTEFYSARLANSDRKQTLVEEVLAGEKQTGRFKSKYNEVQDKKRSGKKAFYKALKAKRKGFWKI